ncbi:peptide/nickel transport system ATP-binding protein/oligopeptide transport system ATP-binding protein [Stella humosa]|uniref:Peptide/nickel transport system ATP-binding protein/oligopeptide transport system ATP-binding protein n=1 Tax=Stella humosa TaxID=94 RepID=A0A3N1MEP2_9PROT|nr:ABC transporter ATP-binding protein [Stella humosa]ROQ02028.1 peptide/nickel transport system ATP-binding protein/oligopeptide transport system ATP-binding protein [Stella humosa]BBK32418.1 ABC transporter ATP-binding protein [Stella humosa]
MDAGPLLEVRDLRTGFRTRRGMLQAVDGVAFAVARGETVAIVGESGSGKSVTAMSILRLFGRTDRASIAGSILLHGREGGVRDLLTLPEPALRDVRGREIAVIFQDPSASLNPVFTIGEQIREAIRRHRPGDAARADAVAVELLRDVGIADPERRVAAYPHQLSGGMRQRVMIAIALACQPRLLIADEPTTALDVTIQAQIMRLLADLKSARGMGLLFITHDLALVGEIADRVVVMYAGQVVETGATAAILARPRHPYTRALLECRPERRYRDDGQPDDRLLRPIAGAPPRPTEIPAGCRFAPRCPMAEARCTAGPVSLEPVPDDRSSRCLRWAEMA